MSLSLKASLDGLSTELLLGATLLAKFDVNGVADGVLISSDAEAQALTNSKKLITPEKLAKAFQGSNQLLSGSGYQKLPGGLIIQWGASTISAGANVPQSFTLPIAFPTGAIRFVASSASAGTYAGATNLTTTQITLFASNNTAGVTWFAIGY